MVGVEPGKDGKPYYFPDDLTDKSIEWLHAVRAQEAQKPWFIYYSTGCARAASRRHGLGRPLQGRVRQRLGRVPTSWADCSTRWRSWAIWGTR